MDNGENDLTPSAEAKGYPAAAGYIASVAMGSILFVAISEAIDISIGPPDRGLPPWVSPWVSVLFAGIFGAWLTFCMTLFLALPLFIFVHQGAKFFRIRHSLYFCASGCCTGALIAHFLSFGLHALPIAAVVGLIAGFTYWYLSVRPFQAG